MASHFSFWSFCRRERSSRRELMFFWLSFHQHLTAPRKGVGGGLRNIMFRAQLIELRIQLIEALIQLHLFRIHLPLLQLL